MMELFFATPEQICQDKIVLDAFETNHLTHTLRKQKGDIIFITDGQGNVYRSTILELNKKVTAQINEHKSIPRPNIFLGLGVGFIRPNRLDFILEKCTELGVMHFIIFRSQYSNYLSLHTERFNKILRQAIKQSQQYYLPKLSIVDSFNHLFLLIQDYGHKILALSPDHPSILNQIRRFSVSQRTSILLVVGPEGGFSDNEIELFKNNKFDSVSLGKNRLRTETAAMSGIAILQTYYNPSGEGELGNE